VINRRVPIQQVRMVFIRQVGMVQRRGLIEEVEGPAYSLGGPHDVQLLQFGAGVAHHSQDVLAGGVPQRQVPDGVNCSEGLAEEGLVQAADPEGAEVQRAEAPPGRRPAGGTGRARGRRPAAGASRRGTAAAAGP